MSNYPAGVTDDNPHFDLPSADPPWLTALINEGGEFCRNCRYQWRIFTNPVVETCPNPECRDEAYDVYIVSEIAELLHK